MLNGRLVDGRRRGRFSASGDAKAGGRRGAALPSPGSVAMCAASRIRVSFEASSTRAGRRGFARRRFFVWTASLEGREKSMFESLSDRLSGVFDRLRGRGALNEADVRGAMREVRIALLEADVALPGVREFVDRATEQAVGQQVLRSVTPGQQVVKIVHDALVEMLGAAEAGLDLAVTPPAVIMMVGLP